MTQSTTTLQRRARLWPAPGARAAFNGYPLTETIGTCALQTAEQARLRPGSSACLDGCAPMNTLHHAPRPSTHEDRDVVTPANDLLYLQPG